MRSFIPRTVATLLITLVAGCYDPQVELSKSFPPPGRLVYIGGRKLHLDCTGKGSPTVVLMAGGDAYSIDWALVQPRLSQSTRVCSYERAGLGWSDPGPAQDTVEETLADLNSLLHAADEKAPFVLVGASIGGPFIQAYQHAYPQQVAALVFTNSSNQIGMTTRNKDDLIWRLTEDELRSAYPLHPSSRPRPPRREGDPFNKLPPNLQDARLWLDTRLWAKSDPTKVGPEMMLSWRKEFLREFESTDTGKKPPLGDLPVVVLSSNPPANPSDRQSTEGAAARLDFLSTNTVHITATGSGHEIHLYQPDRVVDAITHTLIAVRTHATLAHQ